MNENNFHTVYRRDRVVGKGGGAAFFIKKHSNIPLTVFPCQLNLIPLKQLF